ncbi:hypothetical protein M514_26440 [Trichuris suis]|uniref:Uncharacterized protein n=1 Tax=Trichuris suis TaxID=68888 RepID=A0A085MVY9_9BILA|nr:hypothetical protein M514_26440 [Trichuris suis]
MTAARLQPNCTIQSFTKTTENVSQTRAEAVAFNRWPETSAHPTKAIAHAKATASARVRDALDSFCKDLCEKWKYCAISAVSEQLSCSNDLHYRVLPTTERCRRTFSLSTIGSNMKDQLYDSFNRKESSANKDFVRRSTL